MFLGSRVIFFVAEKGGELYRCCMPVYTPKKDDRTCAEPYLHCKWFLRLVVEPPLRRLLHLVMTAPPLKLGPNELGLGPLLLLFSRWLRCRRRRTRGVGVAAEVGGFGDSVASEDVGGGMKEAVSTY
ncbi:hypothetical protein E2542_SST00071 [Spatholobus suberectus]|nr:hypothetical protein E2542_SST00071 [Spatholobus suberectus]